MPTPVAVSTGFARVLEDKFIDEDLVKLDAGSRGARYSVQYPLRFSVEAGQRFDRIVQRRDNSASGASVHAFVERETGLLIKAAGYKAPQKSKTHKTGWATKFDLSTREGFEAALEAATWNGGYLYA